MSLLNFDATQVKPSSGQPDPVPGDWYNMMIDETEMKPTKDKQGELLEIRLNILDGQFAGRKVYDRLNLKNNSVVAQEIGHGTLSAICHATGVMQPQDSQQLHGIPMKVKVKIKPASGNYSAQNEVTSYKNMNEQVGANATTGQAPVNVQTTSPAQTQNAPANWQQASPTGSTGDPVTMTPGLDYAEHIKAGWTNETLIANGKATAKVAVVEAPPNTVEAPPNTVEAPPGAAGAGAATTGKPPWVT